MADPNRGTGRTQRQLEQLLSGSGRVFFVARTEHTARVFARRLSLMCKERGIAATATHSSVVIGDLAVEFCGLSRDLREACGEVHYDHACAVAY